MGGLSVLTTPPGDPAHCATVTAVHTAIGLDASKSCLEKTPQTGFRSIHSGPVPQEDLLNKPILAQNVRLEGRVWGAELGIVLNMKLSASKAVGKM